MTCGMTVELVNAGAQAVGLASVVLFVPGFTSWWQAAGITLSRTVVPTFIRRPS